MPELNKIRVFLSILATLSILLGVLMSGIWIWIAVPSLFGSAGDLWMLLIALSFVCFGAIAVTIGIKYLIHQDTAHAKGLAGMVGFIVWMFLNAKISEAGRERSLDDPSLFWFYFLGPIIVGILIYRSPKKGSNL